MSLLDTRVRRGNIRDKTSRTRLTPISYETSFHGLKELLALHERDTKELLALHERDKSELLALRERDNKSELLALRERDKREGAYNKKELLALHERDIKNSSPNIYSTHTPPAYVKNMFFLLMCVLAVFIVFGCFVFSLCF